MPERTPTSTTATPEGAREHARAMAGERVLAQPTVPPSGATELPGGVDSADVIWDEVIATGDDASAELSAGAVLRATDLAGDACASMLVYNARRPIERLNAADTVKVQWSAYLGAGSLLLSDMGRALMSVRADTCSGHDILCGPSTIAGNAARYGDGTAHGATPAARARLTVALAKLGLGRRDLVPSLNLFSPVRVEAYGALTLLPGGPEAGSFVELSALLDVIVVVANAPHPLDERPTYERGPVRLTAWMPSTASSTGQASIEQQRALDNTRAYLAGAPA